MDMLSNSVEQEIQKNSSKNQPIAKRAHLTPHCKTIPPFESRRK